MTPVLHIGAFSDGNRGGNPAGVWIGDVLPDASKMQTIAADVGFSETAFAAAEDSASAAPNAIVACPQNGTSISGEKYRTRHAPGSSIRVSGTARFMDDA